MINAEQIINAEQAEIKTGAQLVLRRVRTKHLIKKTLKKVYKEIRSSIKSGKYYCVFDVNLSSKFDNKYLLDVMHYTLIQKGYSVSYNNMNSKKVTMLLIFMGESSKL